jgi:7-carboxy-7-deazaguanine synthase
VVIDHRLKHCVITGGEPAMYNLEPLSQELIDRGITVQLETSGTEMINIANRAWVTVSPKVHRDILPSAMARADEIKHPVGTVDDITALIRLLERFPARVVPREDRRIFVQPLSQSKKATQICISAASAHGWRVSFQTHKYVDFR